MSTRIFMHSDLGDLMKKIRMTTSLKGHGMVNPLGIKVLTFLIIFVHMFIVSVGHF